MNFKEFGLSLMLCFAIIAANAQEQIFTSEIETIFGNKCKLYLKYGGDDYSGLMVIAAPEDSIQYTDAIEIPQTVWITDSTIDNGPQTINLPVMEIDENAFRGTIIEAIFIATAGKIGNNAFYGCTNLKKVVFDNIDQMIWNDFKNEYSNPLYYAKHLFFKDDLNNEVKSLHFTEKLETINQYAFAGGENIDSIFIPANIRSIQSKAFLNCNNLKKVQFASLFDLLHINFADKEANPLFYYHHLFANNEESEITSITIPTGISHISAAAFAGCNEITKVTISEDVLSIGNDAFYGCNNIYTVDYPSLDALTYITYGNENSNPLRYAKMFLVKGSEQSSLTINENVKDYAFYGAEWLETVTFEKNVYSIGKNSFRGCSNLKNVIFQGTELETINNDAFNGCSNLENIWLPSSLKEIGIAAFRNCGQLGSIIIPENTTSIGDETFVGCGNLKSAIINAKITSIPKRMFSNCTSLSNVNISESILTIKEEAFSGCSSLSSLPEGSTITYIYSNAFANCNGLEELTLPDSIKVIGKRAFSGCLNLSNIFIPNSIRNLTIGTEAFAPNNLRSIYTYPLTAPESDPSAFGNELGSIYLFYTSESVGYDKQPWCDFNKAPFSMKTITYFIDNDAIYSETIQVGEKIVPPPASMTIKEGWEFSGWIEGIPTIMPNQDLDIHGFFTTKRNINGLTYLIEPTKTETKVIPDTVAYRNLTDAAVPDSISFENKKYCVTTIEAQAFMNCKNLQTVVLSDTLQEIGAGAFMGCTDLQKITLPPHITSVKDSTFFGCTGLVSVTLTDSIVNIGKSAFSACNSLIIDSLPSHLNTLGDLAFCKSGINTIRLPKNIKQFGKRVFEDCSQLDSVFFDSDIVLTTIPEHTFINCRRLKAFTLATSTKTIGAGAFQGCIAINQLNLENGLQNISENAFDGCSGLINITLPKSIETIGNNAFEGCNAINQITINERTVAPLSAASAFSDATYNNASLYVSNVDEYKSKSPWKRFGDRIYEIAENPLIYKVDGTLYSDTIMRVGTTITPLPAPTKEGHSFSGWRNLPTVMPNDTVIVTGAFKYEFTFINEDSKEAVFSDSLFYGDSFASLNNSLPEKLTRKGYRYEIIGTLNTMPACDTIISVHYYPTETDYTDNGLTYHIYTEITKEADYVHAELIPGEQPYSQSSIIVPEVIEYEKVKYPVTVIRTDAFKSCYNLTSVSLSDSIRIIGTQAFRNCGNLQKIIIPDSVRILGDEIFWGCYNLEEVIFANDNIINEVTANMFQDCKQLESIELPSSITLIANDAFRGCSILKDIYIPENVTIIGDRAFNGCDKLLNITIGNKSALPEAFDYTFDPLTYENATLLVSAELQNNLTEPWSKFRNVDLGDSVNVEQCKKPIISYIKGELVFSCETPDAKITSEVRIDDAKKSQESTQALTQTYVITAYATATGKKRSDVTKATMTWISGSSTLTTEGFDKVELQEKPTEAGTPGDMNGDNKITAEDAALILKQLVGKKKEENNNNGE